MCHDSNVYMMASFQRLVSAAGSNTVQYVLVGENGQITPLGQPLHTQPQVRTAGQTEAGVVISNILYRAKLETWTWVLTARPRRNLNQKT